MGPVTPGVFPLLLFRVSRDTEKLFPALHDCFQHALGFLTQTVLEARGRAVVPPVKSGQMIPDFIRTHAVMNVTERFRSDRRGNGGRRGSGGDGGDGGDGGLRSSGRGCGRRWGGPLSGGGRG